MPLAAPANQTTTRGEAERLAARLPAFAIAARQVAQSVMSGVHGRRRAGPGETFWQFRPFLSGEPAARIDWRRSAREDRAFVREREWEAAHSVYLWFDRTASMDFRSHLAQVGKLERAAVLALASAQLLLRGGERVGLLGLTRANAKPGIIERFADVLARAGEGQNLPPMAPLSGRTKILLIGDFFGAPAATIHALDRLSGEGATGQMIMIADPIEEVFPYEGHVEFLTPGGRQRLTIARAQSLRSDYLAALAEHRDSLRRACLRLGWGFALHRTDGSAAAALLALWARWDVDAASARGA